MRMTEHQLASGRYQADARAVLAGVHNQLLFFYAPGETTLLALGLDLMMC